MASPKMREQSTLMKGAEAGGGDVGQRETCGCLVDGAFSVGDGDGGLKKMQTQAQS